MRMGGENLTGAKSHGSVFRGLYKNQEYKNLIPPLPISNLQDGVCPLHCSAANGHKECVMLLLKKGAKINAATNVSRISGAVTRCHPSLFVAFLGCA
jgi:ankyrin repeat protein